MIKIKSVLFRLKRSAYRVGAGGGKAGANGNLLRRAIAIPLVVLAVLYVTGNALIHVLAAVIISIHFSLSPFKGIVSVYPYRLHLYPIF